MSDIRARLIDAVLASADSTVGWHEEPRGSNDAPFIRGWLADVGVHAPAPWCVAATHAWWSIGSLACGVANPHPRTAGSRRFWALVPSEAKLKVPVRGCVAAFRHLDRLGQDTGQGHVALVEEVLAGGKVRTIDGNSNGEGSRNGDEVVRHVWDWQLGRRGSLVVLGYADLSLLVPDSVVA